MRRLQEQGLGALAAPPPPLAREAQQALACWDWCGGWQPQLLPAFAALHGVDDIYTLTELLLVIRDARP